MSSLDRRSLTRATEAWAPEVRRAHARLAGGNPRGALKAIDEFLSRNPDDPPALFEKSRILYEMGDRPAALDARLRALKIKGAPADVASVADLLVEDGLHGEAEAFLLARLADDPTAFTTRFALAKLFLFTGRFVAAGREIDRLYRSVKRGGPLVRADYLEALRLALLGDEAALTRLVERLRRNKVAGARLTFFVALATFLSSGDADAFAAVMGQLTRDARRQESFFQLFRRIQPDLFLGCESRRRADFQRVLGDRLRGPRITGVSLPPDQVSVVRDLFHSYAAIRILEIEAPDSGYSGDRVFRVYTEQKEYREYSCLLKIGLKHRIAIEKEKMSDFVAGKLHPNFHPQVISFAHGFRTAALRLSWATATDDVPRSLRGVYTDDGVSASDMARYLSSLFNVVLAGWHARNTRPRPCPIFTWLGRRVEAFAGLIAERQAESRRDVATGQIALPTLGREIADPAPSLQRLVKARGREKPLAPFGLHHGDLNARNVLIDGQDNLCLIDFYKSGPGLMLHDYARLEVDLRYEALPDAPTQMEDLRWMDERLAREARPESWRGLDVRRSLGKRLGVAVRLREFAWEHLDGSNSSKHQLYAAALLDALLRALLYRHLSAPVTDLALAEINDLCEVLGGS